MNKTTPSSLALLTLLAICIPCAASHEPNNLSSQPKGNRFSKLAEQAEALYGQSSASKQGQPEEPAAPAPVAPPAQPPQEQKKSWSFFDYFKSESKPILARHKEFSDEWWSALWDRCRGCKYYAEGESTQPIDCKKMLAANPQWKEVKNDMNQNAKDLIMKRALIRLHDDRDACSLACATCVGGNPDTRLEGASPHTALHVTSGNVGARHNPLFRLLLTMGADPELKCQPALPSEFVHDGCRADLRKAIAQKHARERFE